MATIRTTPEGFQRDLRRRLRGLPKLVEKAMKSGAKRGRRLLVRRTPVDTGQMKNAWRTTGLDDFENINDAPHAGIIEGGARPHKVNRAGRLALERWAMRQLGVDANTAKAVAAGTIRKLERFGQKGLFIVRDSLPELREEVAREVIRRVRRQAGRKAK